jgi:hypothetical protein
MPMMTYYRHIYRHIYRHAPAAVPLPPELHDRRVEVIVLTIDDASPEDARRSENALGWPAGFFEETFGSVPDHPARSHGWGMAGRAVGA